MASTATLSKRLRTLFNESDIRISVAFKELSIDVPATQLSSICLGLRDDGELQFEQLIDLCGVDYSCYGKTGAQAESVNRRYAVVYHLLSVTLNHRMRVRALIDGEPAMIASVMPIWQAAEWYEREAFDLYGIIFEGHNDLRRLLTDYGFIGHPLRKDFPLSGHVEMRYDEDKGRIVYGPVSIEPRTITPRRLR